ncbi:MAG: ATP-dependent RecD-like DNA helicase [Clostridiales bacterium]|nr:ATP-dependent RecD-like DNA helicase [Clostridiales bacterium]
MEQPLLELCGAVEQIIFRNEKNGYTVLELSVGEELVTAVGSMPWVNEGESVRLLGGWKSHPNFGTQFQAEACERTLPASAEAILRYLSSRAVKGIGPSTAAKLVDAFGERTLEVMEKEPERLCSIKGITRARAMKIAEEFRNVFGIREVMVSLGAYGITPEEAVRIWKLWGSQAVERIHEDPYSLCEEPLSLSFDRADGIAASLERPQDDRCRVRAGILHVLKHNMNNGHTCLPKEKLLGAVSSFLGVEQEQAEEEMDRLVLDASLVAELVEEQEFVFLPKMHRCETYSAGRLLMMRQYPPQRITGIEKEIAAIERKEGIQYAALQRQAIRDALEKGLLILTGGPGTGKTTTLNAIITILENKGEKVYLAAPTGRAAQRMSEVTGKEAKTIHRLLEVAWDEEDKPTFTRNERNMLECDALILDELSMVDSYVFEGVLRAMPLGCRFLMVGDCDQLPSVGPGNVLGDLIRSGAVPVVQLNEIFRQSMRSLIVQNAHRIVKGEMPELSVHDSDFFFLNQGDPASISATIVDLCTRRLPKTYGYSPLFDIQVLSPGRKGELGSRELNLQLQQAINPPSPEKKEWKTNGVTLREGDKVMQVRNNYDLIWEREDGVTGEGVFNGDVGILLKIDRPASSLVVQFDDRTAVYELESANDLELAYAVTIHKSQGSEFEAVVMPMYPGPRQLCYRNLLYTGVTRAKSLLVMVGVRRTVAVMVENNRRTKRYSGLYPFLIRGLDDE